MAGPHTWVSADGDWTQTSSWDTALVPAAGEIVLFTGASVVSVTTGPATGLNYTSVNIHEDYTGTIMSSGSPLKLGTVTTVRFASRGGKAFFDCETGDTVSQCINTSAGGVADGLYLSGDGTWTDLDVSGATGQTTVASSATLTNLTMGNSPNATVTIQSSVSGLTLCRIDSGLVDCSSAIATGEGRLLISGGRWIHRIGAITDAEVVAQGQRAILEHLSSGAITDLFCMGAGAIFDGRGNRSNAITVTRAEAWNGAQVLARNALKTYSFTNGVKGYNASVIDYEIGEEVTQES